MIRLLASGAHRKRRSGLLAAAVLAWLAHPAAALEVRLGDGEIVLFDQARQACDDSHLPDAPARAFRNSDGATVLFAPNFRNRAFEGPDLFSLKADCRSRFKAAGSSDPALLDDRTWLHAVYTADGSNVFALASASFMPYRHGGSCQAGKGARTDCWLNGIAALFSGDGGRSFAYGAKPPRHLVFPPPEAYRPDRVDPPGFVTATNIVRWDGYLYTILWRREAEARYNCLARAPEGTPQAWELLSGGAFVPAARLAADGWRVASTDCDPIGPDGMRAIRGFVRHEGSGTFIAVMQHRRRVENRVEHGFFVSTSRDLVEWSRPQLLMPVRLQSDAAPDEDWAAYPTLIDADSADRNFGTMDDTASLVFVRLMPRPGGRKGLTRQLVAVPVTIENRQAGR